MSHDTQDKPAVTPPGYGPEVEKAHQGYVAVLDRIAAARKAAMEPPSPVAGAVSEQTDTGISEHVIYLAHKGKELHAGIFIGDVLDHMETEHNRAEKLKRNENLEIRTRESFNRKRAHGVPPTTSYEPKSFDRDAAMTTLIGEFPWLNPKHPDNPMRQQARIEGQRVARQLEAFKNPGGTSAEYFLGMGSYRY